MLWDKLFEKNLEFFFFWATKKLFNQNLLFPENSFQNMLDTKTKLLLFVDPKLWLFKSGPYQKKNQKFQMPITRPLGDLAPKHFALEYLQAKNDQNRREGCWFTYICGGMPHTCYRKEQ